MKLSNIYLIKWYGPFSTKEEIKEWEDIHLPIRFNLYAFQARQKSKKDKYYCGMTYKQTVGNRLNNHDHHIHDFEDRTELIQIWIGTIANKKAKKSDVRICEKMITSQLASEAGVGKGNLENKTNKKPPINNVYIINEWWKTNEGELKKKTHGSVPDVIPEVMAYYSETKALYGANKLKPICDL